jgi:diketogulonate reductase-like aldo/keto reductase
MWFALVFSVCELTGNFNRPLHWFGRAVLLTFIPQSIRRRHRLREPSPLLEWIVQKAFKYAFDYKDSQPDPVTAPLEEFYGKLQTWDMNKIDAMETANRDEQTRRFNVVVTVFGLLVMGALAYHLGIL